MSKIPSLIFAISIGMLINAANAITCKDIIIQVPSNYKVEGFRDKGAITKIYDNNTIAIYHAKHYWGLFELGAEAKVFREGKSEVYIRNVPSDSNYEQKVEFYLDGKFLNGKSGNCTCKTVLFPRPTRRCDGGNAYPSVVELN